MKLPICLASAALAFLPGAVLAQDADRAAPKKESLHDAVENHETVFDGDFAIVGGGIAAVPTYEGSNNTRALPLAGITGEVAGVGFTVRGPSLSLDLVEIRLSDGVTLNGSPQVRYRAGRSGNLGDDVVEKLPKTDGVLEGGFRVGVSIKEAFSHEDNLSIGVSARWDISGKGSGRVITPSATYRLPLSRAQAIGVLVSTQFIDGDYADYNYSIDAQGSADSGLPVFDAKGGFKEFTVGVGTARDLSGDVLDGGFLIGAGAIYTRLFGSAAQTPTTSIRGSRDQWLLAAGLGYIF